MGYKGTLLSSTTVLVRGTNKRPSNVEECQLKPDPRQRRTRSSSRAHATSSSTAATGAVGTSRANGRTPKPNPKSKLQPTRKRARHGKIELGAASPDGATNCPKALAKLEVLMRVPIDIFVEIAEHLHPLDLVALSRANKFFRELFMNRRAIPVWRTARLNIPGLPPCPGSICEAQYAVLLFANVCSTCGKRTSREVDSILLIRLCATCYDKHAVNASTIKDRTLVFVSYDYVRAKRHLASWCLNKDVQAVESKLNEFDASGDAAAKIRWIEERRKEVNRRYWDVQPLREWLGVWHTPGEAELEPLKVSRQAEIESRLVNLGWEEIDFTSDERWRNMRWKSLLYRAEPLTDEAWEKLLSDLLSRLKQNREERLFRQRSSREMERKPILTKYLNAIIAQFGPFAQAIPGGELPKTTLVNTSWNFERNKLLLDHPFPSTHILYSWPELRTIIESSVPMQGFMATLDEQRQMFRTLIVTWRNTLEAELVKLLPEDTKCPELDNIPGFTLTTGTRECTKPISDLPTGSKKLLRADVIFKGQDRLRFYPDDFVNTGVDASSLTYHAEAAKVARTLMNTLGRSHASYLELKALGRVFHCGRCNSPPHYMTWQELVQHYLAEADIWSQHSLAQEVREAEDFILVFTHDVHVVKPTKPLVRIADGEGKITRNYNGTKRCKLCQRVLIRRWFYNGYIVDHVRDVHLIEEPELGEHFG